MCPYTKNLCEDNPNFTHPVVWAIEEGGKKKRHFQVGLVKSVWSFLSCVLHKLAQLSIDETLSSFTKRTHPRKGEKKKQGTWIIVEASKQPKRGRTTRWKGKPLSTTQNLH
jgi:hypothetical protein